MATRPLYKRLGYKALQIFFRLSGVGLFGLRVFGREHTVNGGPVLICSNHQSHFDPILVGLSIKERMNALARRSLFEIPLLKQLIEFLDAIPIERDGPAIAGIKETLKRLKSSEQVLIFPEGTRTSDGEVAPLKSGFVTLARRTDALLLPVGIDGAYQAWPRTRMFPGLAQITVVFDAPIYPAEYAALTDEELVAELERRMRQCHARARAYRQSCELGSMFPWR